MNDNTFSEDSWSFRSLVNLHKWHMIQSKDTCWIFGTVKWRKEQGIEQEKANYISTQNQPCILMSTKDCHHFEFFQIISCSLLLCRKREESLLFIKTGYLAVLVGCSQILGAQFNFYMAHACPIRIRCLLRHHRLYVQDSFSSSFCFLCT